ncbi:MAG: hypothetical protein ACHREM_11610 [Polyangiales bacterium]
MYVIHKLEGRESKLLAAFTLVDGRTVFDETRGEPAFVQALRKKGVRVRRADGVVDDVMPHVDGLAFRDACLARFGGCRRSLPSAPT